jgi:hypothetical protein
MKLQRKIDTEPALRDQKRELFASLSKMGN